ncbi:MAG: multidrug transporter [Candidatus Altiarchaeales archaeon]|nr:multidrug transporter [Candidatus Altiarchaeales archaeon]
MVEWWAPPLVVFGTLLGAVGAVYFKKASCKLKPSFSVLIANHELFLGFFFYGVSALVYIVAVRGGELSVIYPLVSTSYIWVCLLSVRVLGEQMNTVKWLGVLLIIAGVSVIGLGA